MDRTYVQRVVAVVAATTVLLTAALVGVVAVAEGQSADASARVPFYVFGAAVLFVATLVTLEDPEEGGLPILTTTVAVSVVGFALLALASEGFLYAGRNPGSVFGSSLVLYFVAAALVCTGTVYWALNHWREFTA